VLRIAELTRHSWARVNERIPGMTIKIWGDQLMRYPAARPNGRAARLARVAFNGPGRWVVLAGQTRPVDEKATIHPTWPRRSARRCGGSSSFGGGGRGPRANREAHLVSDQHATNHQAAGSGIGAAWEGDVGRKFSAIDAALPRWVVE